MLEIGAFEAKNTLESLLDRVEHGEEIVITRHGKPVARLIPHSGSDRAQARAALARLRKRASKLKSVCFDRDDLKADRDTGRP
jgi:prevent-host-death family protein